MLYYTYGTNVNVAVGLQANHNSEQSHILSRAHVWHQSTFSNTKKTEAGATGSYLCPVLRGCSWQQQLLRRSTSIRRTEPSNGQVAGTACETISFCSCCLSAVTFACYITQEAYRRHHPPATETLVQHWLSKRDDGCALRELFLVAASNPVLSPVKVRLFS